MLRKYFKFSLICSLLFVFWGWFSVLANWPVSLPVDATSPAGWLGEIFDLDKSSSGELVVTGNIIADDPTQTGHLATKHYVDEEILNGWGWSGNVQIFESDGVWTKPAGVKLVEVRLLAGWGGGGAPKSGATYRLGGGGGGGEFKKFIFLADNLSDSVNVTVGKGGTGATPYNVGVNGEDTKFGSYLQASAGRGGHSYGGGGDWGMTLNVATYNGDFDRIPGRPKGGMVSDTRCNGVSGWYAAGGGSARTTGGAWGTYLGCLGGDSLYGGAGGGAGAMWATVVGGIPGTPSNWGVSPWGNGGRGGSANPHGNGSNGQHGGRGAGGGWGWGGKLVSWNGGNGGDGIAMIISY